MSVESRKQSLNTGAEDRIESCEEEAGNESESQNTVLFVSHLPISCHLCDGRLTARHEPLSQPVVQHLLLFWRGAAREDHVIFLLLSQPQECRPLKGAHPVFASRPSDQGARHERSAVPRARDVCALLHHQLRGSRERKHLPLDPRPHRGLLREDCASLQLARVRANPVAHAQSKAPRGGVVSCAPAHLQL